MVFIRGEKLLRASQLSDVKVWNRKHGWMWIIYGVCTVLAWLCGMMIGDSIVACAICDRFFGTTGVYGAVSS